MEKAELQKLVELELPTKPTFDELAFHVKEQQRLLGFLLHSLATQGASIIAVRQDMLEVKGDLLLHEVPRRGKKPAIIMPDTKLELN